MTMAIRKHFFPLVYRQIKLLKEKMGLGDCHQGFDFKQKAPILALNFLLNLNKVNSEE
ncbi:MAG: hypothetical protein H7829_10580 [Magnetococcus sp. THC-1_WYH]